MKRLISILLTVCMVAGVSIPAHAIGTMEDEELPENELSPVQVVTTLDELQTAVESAEDGDTIALGQTIYINGETVSTDKAITIVRADSFTSGDMLEIYNGVVDGFHFKESVSKGVITVFPIQDSKIVIKNCTINGGGVGEGISVIGTSSLHQVTINDCEFSNCYKHAVNAQANTDVSVEECYIHDTYYDISASGAVQSSGSLKLTRCTITANTSWANAGLMCSGGTLKMDDCQIKDNIILSPDNGIAVDIFCLDTIWSLSNSKNTLDAGYYDITTGEKLAIPVVESSEFAKLIFLTDEEAKDYFAPPTSPDEGATLPGDGDDHPDPAPDDDSNTPDGDGGGEGTIPDKEPDNPEAGEDEDGQIPDVMPPTEDGESGQQPEEPIPPTTGTDNDGDTSDNDQSATERPEKPAEDDSNNSNDYTPSRPHKPVQRPSEPDTDIQQPEEEPPVPALVCGDAIIDTSRSVVLAGYGDGLLHEEDPLTRAQLATIVYRLLTDESISSYREGQAIFNDVSAGAWYYQAVTTIGHAGIVSGVGGGRYDPDGLVTWVQAITVLSRFVDQQEYKLKHITYNGWALPYLETAVALGWISDGSDFAPDSIINRGELVSLYNRVLETYK